MKRKLGAILFVIYAIIAITVTVLLLSFNDYNISEIGDYTIYIVDNDGLEPEYKQGSILIMESTSDKHVKIGDEIFLYKVINSQEFEIVTKTLIGKSQQGRHIVYEVDGGESYASEYFIGKVDEVTVIEGPWGTILSILESKWGYLFCIVIVSLLLFLQEVFDLIIEIKYGSGKGSKSGKGTKKTSTGTKKTSTATRTATKPVAKPVARPEVAANIGSETQTGEKEG